jgi:DNA modification methylase
LNKIYNENCLEGMKLISDKSIDMVLTDIPYEKVNKKSNGLRTIDKDTANTKTFNLIHFLDEVNRITKGSIIIFCGHEQYSSIYDYFNNQKGTTRGVCWHKTNPSPMNGEYIYLNSFELAVRFKHNIFNTSVGSNKIHPTQKNLDLFKELILDNTKENDIILDPCMGSGTTAIACINTKRQYIGFELDNTYYNLANERINNHLKLQFQEKII